MSVLDTAPIILIGMMGAGKTTIGRQLAKQLNRRFLDSDHEIQARCGVRIATIFEMEGEEGFRRRESHILEKLSLEQDVVLATGGGAVLSEKNRQCLSQRGIVVYLRATPQELWLRLRHDKVRPLIQTASNPQERIAELHAERHPLYTSLADIVIDTGRPPLARIVRSLIMELQACPKTFTL